MVDFWWFVIELELHTVLTLLTECLNRWLPLIGKWHAPKQEAQELLPFPPEVTDHLHTLWSISAGK